MPCVAFVGHIWTVLNYFNALPIIACMPGMYYVQSMYHGLFNIDVRPSTACIDHARTYLFTIYYMTLMM